MLITVDPMHTKVCCSSKDMTYLMVRDSDYLINVQRKVVWADYGWLKITMFFFILFSVLA